MDSDNVVQTTPTPVSTNIVTVDGRPSEKDRLTAGILAILLGGFGIHKFYLGYTKQRVTMLLLVTFGSLLVSPIFATAITAVSEGIIYLTKSDQDFYDTYVSNQKVWF
ncbi:MAG: hypothetical protein CMB61_06530 [Euryarchaeota archaeon]|nr:hypothetical protein [Euryarchaeota archaeon]